MRSATSQIQWDDYADAALKAARRHFPKKRPRVVKTFSQTGRDQFGDSSIWIWVVLEDSTDPEAFHVSTRCVRRAVRDGFRQQGIGELPYVRFMTKSQFDSRPRPSAE